MGLKNRSGTKADMYFKDIVNKILTEGCEDINPRPKWSDGTPAHSISINGYMCRYDLTKGESPIMTLRPIAIKSAINEIFWIYQEQSNDVNLLEAKYGVHYWNPWALEDSTIGACYGETVKRHDLINNLLKDIEEDHDGRRHIMNLWQEDDFKDPHALKPCCLMTNFNIRHGKDGKEYLDMALYQRSCDFITAASTVNPVQYYALQCMVAYHFGITPGIFTHFLNNIQIYDRHIDIAKEMLKRKGVKCSPSIVISPYYEKKSFFELTPDDIHVSGYPGELIKLQNPSIKVEVAV